jgi:hypothetical protein
LVGIAECPTGYTVTGGGFDSINVFIVTSMPLEKGNGWEVIGVPSASTAEVGPISWKGDPALRVYAVCAKID